MMVPYKPLLFPFSNCCFISRCDFLEIVTGFKAPGVMKKKTSCHIKGNINIYMQLSNA